MSFQFLLKFAREHPISWSAIIVSFATFSVLSFLLLTVARLGFNQAQIDAIISENQAPKTFELFGTVVILFLTARAVLKGSVGVPSKGLSKHLSITIPNTLLAIQSAIAGELLGACLSSAAPAGKILSASLNAPWATLGVAIVVLVLAYMTCLTLTVSKTTAPKFATPWFSRGYRTIAAIILFAVLGRTLILLTILGMQVPR